MYKEAALGAVMALGAAFLYGKSHEAFSGDVGKGRNAAVCGRFCRKIKFYILKMRILPVSNAHNDSVAGELYKSDAVRRKNKIQKFPRIGGENTVILTVQGR